MSIFRFRVFKEYLLQAFRSWAEYSLNFGISLFWAVFGLIVVYFFWTLVFDKATIHGYDIYKIMFYYFFVDCMFYDVMFVRPIQRTIINGDIIKNLVRKIRFEEYLFYKIISIFCVWHIIPFFALLVAGTYFLGFSAVFGLVIFLLGLAIGVLVYSIVISLSFWTGENWAIALLLDKIIIFSAGNAIPLDLFPGWLYSVLTNYLPFNLMFFVPAKIFLGDMAITWVLIAKYLLWIFALYLVLRFMIKRGLRKYEQLGG